MKSIYIAPHTEVINMDVERHLCNASKGNYDLGNDNNEQGPIVTPGPGEGPDVTSAKGHHGGVTDWEGWD